MCIVLRTVLGGTKPGCTIQQKSAVDVDAIPSVERRYTEPEGVMGEESKCTSYRASRSGAKGVS